MMNDLARPLADERLAALHRYAILDTPREVEFDDIAVLASEICGTPIAVVNLIGDGRQWFKAEVGLGVRETPVETSFCAHAILEQDFMLVPDATQDARFAGNPLVTAQSGIRFYAGAILKTPDGFPIGTVCVLDTAPRSLSEQQVSALQRLARQVMTQLALRLALAEQQASGARFRTLSDAAPVMMWMTEPDGRCVYLNRSWHDFTGRPEHEMPGSGWLDAAHPDDRANAGATFLAANRDAAAFRTEYRLQRADGTYRWVLDFAAPRFDEAGAFEGFVGSVVDIHERRTAEEALRASENYVRLLLDSTSEGFYSVDRAGNTTLCNAAFLTMLGFASNNEVIGRKLHGLIHHSHPDGSPYDVADCPIYIGASRVAPAHVTDESFFRVDGSALPVEYWVHPIVVDGEQQGAICTFIDVTERRHNERELQLLNRTLDARVADAVVAREAAMDALRQSQKLEAIGQLTGGVAHDFNNLLTVIRGSADLLKRAGLTEARRDRYIAAISETADRAAVLTGQLLAFARRQALRPERFDVGANVRGVAQMIGTLVGSRVEIQISQPRERCYIDADPSQFDTAIVNMAVNARDAMNNEGQLTIAIAAVDRMPGIRMHPPIEGAYVAVSVADTGGGISAEVLERIFEPFFTTKSVGQGTGLGLSQVFGFAKQSNGEVAVESTLGDGTTFTLYLPRASGEGMVATLGVALDVANEGEGTCVLVVEDNAAVGEFATASLAELGFESVLAASAAAALDLLAYDADRFQIVFSDVVMPDMDGIDLARTIGQLHPGLPVVLTSGYSDVLVRDGSKGLEILSKPYSLDDLQRTLNAKSRKRLQTV